ncbi:calcium-binding protein [Solicola sp. PLA-1-18]|uniref:calcium-binding protein n=1 Tax=Solicola sp. PLA-1-18 TaxID=3380532 RepID=UPI003B819F59
MRAKTLQAPVARTRAAALLAALSGALLVVALTPGVADAAVRTSSGKTCTIVGTKGRDVLKGTARRDVICGRGGNDVINGKGGNDVIDGGAGNDRLTGASGNDELIGGAGSDRLSGSAGNDRLTGGSGADTIAGGAGADYATGDAGNDRLGVAGGDDVAEGGAGNDVLDGATGNDRLDGGDGNDSLYAGDGTDAADGGRGNDLVSGGAGNDDVDGADGADRVAGGPGADDGDGGPGPDVVLGETGDDTLGGGSGQDSVDGGPGFNLCDSPSETDDRQIRCALDTEAPVLRSSSLSRTTIDVSHGAQSITVTGHITDDTGVTTVTFAGSYAQRISGTTRDGVWRTTFTVPANYRAGDREVYARIWDRVGREGGYVPPLHYTVVNTVVDQEVPVVRSLTLDRTTVDARREMQWITATVRITDDLAGPSPDVLVCLSHAFPTGSPAFRRADDCSLLSKASGTARDSTWRGSILIPEGADNGTWNADVRVTDASDTHGTQTWWGPDSLAAQQPGGSAGSTLRALPDGAGRFRVIGSAPDVKAPVLTSVRMSPSTVDTTNGAKLVTADVAATDAEGIGEVALFIRGYSARGGPDDEIEIVANYRLTLVHGTPTDGVWRATFVVPGGTPNGTYPVEVRLQDRAHLESLTADGRGWGSPHTFDASTAPTGTHFVVANSP